MLTQADFHTARGCATKLVYRRRGYPTTREHADIAALVAEQTATIATAARRRTPDGRAIPTDRPLAERLATTAAALEAPGDVTLFDAVVAGGGLLAEVDILIKQGDSLRLLTLSPRGLRSDRAHLRAEWRPVLEQLAFACLAVRERWPHFSLRSGLIAPNGRPTEPDPPSSAACLVELDVSAEVAALLPDVAATVMGLLSDEPAPAVRRGAFCRSCEYRVDSTPSGFSACWGEPGDGGGHLLDLIGVGTLPDALLAGLIDAGTTRLRDLPDEALGTTQGSGSHRDRQRRQLRQTRLDAELIDPALPDTLARLPTPLHFVDFETFSPPLPRYDGMRPFDVIAFQWSCHTVAEAGAPPLHAEWLQADDRDPSVAFAESLRAQIGDDGAVLVWSNHERSVLRDIRRRLGDEGPVGLAEWIDRTTAGIRIVDLQRLAARYYYHPLMGGKTTVKAVLGAVWAAEEGLRARYSEFAGANGHVNNPYRLLPTQRVNGQEAVVRNGAGAALAYLRLMGNGTAPSPEEQAPWRALLAQYCRLDTLAMVMIWEHWRSWRGQS